MLDAHSGSWHLLELSVLSTHVSDTWHLGQSLSVRIGLDPTQISGPVLVWWREISVPLLGC